MPLYILFHNKLAFSVAWFRPLSPKPSFRCQVRLHTKSNISASLCLGKNRLYPWKLRWHPIQFLSLVDWIFHLWSRKIPFLVVIQRCCRRFHHVYPREIYGRLFGEPLWRSHEYSAYVSWWNSSEQILQNRRWDILKKDNDTKIKQCEDVGDTHFYHFFTT